MNRLLTIDDLSINFINGENVTPAIQHVSLSVNKGEVVAIVGESGSGKSVTALSILQLLPSPPAVYTSGKILFGVENINLPGASPQQLMEIRGNKIAMIFQEPMTSLNPVKICGEQVAEALRKHKGMSTIAAYEKVLQLFSDVKLPQPATTYKKFPHEISGGQKQRVMIAMAISCDPDLLICDEPTTALDVSVQQSILKLIRELQRQRQMGVVFISHDLGVVSEIADRIIVMYKGTIAEAGEAKEVLNNPSHQYTKALLACRPILHSKGEKLPTVEDFLKPSQANHDISERPVNIQEQVSPSDKSVLVSVQNVSVLYPAQQNLFGKTTAYTTAVNDVSFDIYNGETLGLVGESGCGKTTLGRALLGLLPVSAGRILFDGKDITAFKLGELKAWRKQVQIIFQDPYSSLNPRRKIGDAIAEPLLVHSIEKEARKRKERVIDLLEKVNLKAAHYDRYPHEFSGGQRQRIVIARALALEPSFIVCDESVAALDVSVQAQVLNLLNELKAAFGFTALFISHDLSVVKYISDRIMVMHKGAIEETGESEFLFKNPQTLYTKQLIEAIPGKEL